ncbi:hypothetical protein HBH64_027620 [Parastagonospora nodorum]|nr:hypothetical protein HBH46_045090 [Parastagonospora nodorum]KAH4294524.1 hypothetical protein HBI02_178390 [Parastagonospora nodorum]KAH4527907.1 hypothetical protein HBH87_048150 [Parastagonospora nodorum]KAH4593927.1 hypothetical protein HBH83_044710 [Parastagonospora nodorum]KAH4683051.1 hypothetical protein HBH80_029050 [Parastagonospora nodorum]
MVSRAGVVEPKNGDSKGPSVDDNDTLGWVQRTCASLHCPIKGSPQRAGNKPVTALGRQADEVTFSNSVGRVRVHVTEELPYNSVRSNSSSCDSHMCLSTPSLTILRCELGLLKPSGARPAAPRRSDLASSILWQTDFWLKSLERYAMPTKAHPACRAWVREHCDTDCADCRGERIQWNGSA